LAEKRENIRYVVKLQRNLIKHTLKTRKFAVQFLPYMRVATSFLL